MDGLKLPELVITGISIPRAMITHEKDGPTEELLR
jgi:hypothetical protein